MAKSGIEGLTITVDLPDNSVAGKIDPTTSSLVCNGAPKVTVAKGTGDTYDLVITYNFTPQYIGPKSGIDVPTDQGLFVTGVGDIYDNLETAEIIISRDATGSAAIAPRPMVTKAKKVEHGE